MAAGGAAGAAGAAGGGGGAGGGGAGGASAGGGAGGGGGAAGWAWAAAEDAAAAARPRITYRAMMLSPIDLGAHTSFTLAPTQALSCERLRSMRRGPDAFGARAWSR